MRMRDMFFNEQLKFLSKCTDLDGNPRGKYKHFLPTNIQWNFLNVHEFHVELHTFLLSYLKKRKTIFTANIPVISQLWIE